MSSNSKELQRIYSETHLRRHGHTHKFKMQRREIRVRFNEKLKADPDRKARYLQLDHVNGGGRQHRVKRTVDDIYQDALSDNSGKYQLLCANCNWIKRL